MAGGNYVFEYVSPSLLMKEHGISEKKIQIDKCHFSLISSGKFPEASHNG